MVDLSIIIVSFNTKKVLLSCLKTIYASRDRLKKEVIVVDNDSQDGSVKMVKKRFPQVKLVTAGKNLGFGRANNLGVNVQSGRYLWFLNSDTLLGKNTIGLLWQEAQKVKAQIASCRLLNPDGSIQPQGGFLPRLSRQVAWMLFVDDLPLLGRLVKPYQQRRISFFESDQRPGWLGGTALLVKASLFKKLGGFDEAIFMYAEDVDFCLRAQKLNISPYYFSRPSLTHLGQASGSSRGAVLGEYQGLKYVYKKHKPAWEYPALRWLLKIGAVLRVIIFGIILQDKNKYEVYTQAFKLA